MRKILLCIILCGGSIGWAVPGFSQSLLHLYGDIQWEEKQVKGPVCLEIFGLVGNQSVQVQTNEKGTGYALTVKRPDYTFLSLMFRRCGQPDKVAYVNVQLTESDSVRCDLSFRPQEYMLGEVQVKGSSSRKEQGQRFMRDVEEAMIFAGKKSNVTLTENMLFNKAANNTRQLFRNVPGITIQEGSEGGLQLNIGTRGLNPNRSSNFNMRQNGYDISADPLGYPESYYTPNANDIKEVQVFRGASALQYGSQFGGMVNFKLSEPPADKKVEVRQHVSYGSYGFLSSYTRLSGTLGKFAYYLSGTVKKGNGCRPNADFKGYSVLGQFFYRPSTYELYKLDVLKYHYLEHQPGGLTDKMFAENPFQSNRERNWFMVDWNILSFKYRKTFEESGDEVNFHAVGLYARRFTVGYHTKRVGSPDPQNVERDLQRGIFVNWSMEARYLKRFRLPRSEVKSSWVVGMKYYQGRNTGEQAPGSRGKGPDFTPVERTTDLSDMNGRVGLHSFYRYPNLNLACFSEASLRLGEKWTVVPGLRFEIIRTGILGELSHYRVAYTDGTPQLQNDVLKDRVHKNRTILLAGIAASCKLPRAEFYANATRNYRAITFNDMRTVSPGLAVNPDLKDESGYSSDVGVRSRGKSLLSYDVSAFFLYYGNRIGEYYRENPEMKGTYHRYRDNVGNGISYGVESTCSVDLFSFARVIHEDLKPEVYASVAVTGSRYLGQSRKQIEFVPLYNLKGGLNLSFRCFSAAVQVSGTSFQYTDASNEPMDPNDGVYGIYGAIPGFCVVDASVSYQATRYAGLVLSLQNIGNEIYMTRRATGYPGPGIIPSAPFNMMLTLELHL